MKPPLYFQFIEMKISIKVPVDCETEIEDVLLQIVRRMVNERANNRQTRDMFLAGLNSLHGSTGVRVTRRKK